MENIQQVVKDIRYLISTDCCDETIQQRILNFMDENTESVSDDPTESGVLHVVSESLASDRTDEGGQSSVDGTLEKITDTERVCICSNSIGVCLHLKPNGYCLLNKFQAYPKGS